MLNKLHVALLLMVTGVFISCDQVPDQVTQKSDYNRFLEKDNEVVTMLKKDQDFWDKKLERTPDQFPYLVKLAAGQSKLFKATGDIDYLKNAEANLIKANKATDYRNTGYLKSLARNYISQHRFKEALDLLNKAESLGEKLNGTQKMMFDVHMELGNYSQAEAYLEKIEDRSDFDFLIRYAKWSDHKGDLSTAITYMEKATEKAEDSNLKSMKIWAYTNIADFYGHNDEILKSYKYFLKALELDPTNAYAKKGIAWIIYSHERNPKEAFRILNSITEDYEAPDYYLLKAEMAEYMGDEALKKENMEAYMDMVSNEKYGVMYNGQNVILLAEDKSSLDQAISLANLEIKDRPTPQSYALLAWTYFNIGDYEKSLEIAENHVMKKTYEPGTLYLLAKIYKANGRSNEAEILKGELLESAYELGPVVEKEIRQI